MSWRRKDLGSERKKLSLHDFEELSFKQCKRGCLVVCNALNDLRGCHGGGMIDEKEIIMHTGLSRVTAWYS